MENMKEKTKNQTDPDLKSIQNVCLNMLKEFCEVCEKHNLRYYLAYGTLLGAIRHKGYIPWDDDIDVWMPRPDFERFLKIGQKCMPEYVVEYYSIKNSKAFFRWKPGISIEDQSLKVEFDLDGVKKAGYPWIDILPMDGMPSTEIGRKLHCLRFRLWYAIISFPRAYNQGVLDLNNKSKAKKLLIKLNNGLGIGKRINIVKCFDHIKKFRRKYKFDKCEYVHGSTGVYTDKSVFRREWFDGIRYGEFEGLKVRIPSGTENILSSVYGDYMTPPPKSKRTQSHFTIYKE